MSEEKKTQNPEVKEIKEPETKTNTDYKVTWKGWVALVFLVICFSGVFANSDTPLKALDLMSLVGKFGHAEGAKIAMQGTGGFGAREGFVFSLTLAPVVMIAMGLLEVCESWGALNAAARIFQPILHFIMGVPGVVGLAFVSSFSSSDVGAIMTQNLYKEGRITDDERTIFAAYQYAGSGTVNNTVAAGAALLPISLLPAGIVILLILLVKIIGANFVRFYLKAYHKKHPESLNDVPAE